MPKSLFDDFSEGLSLDWLTEEAGGAIVAVHHRILRLTNPLSTHGHYTNAQIDDYRTLKRSAFRWRPPLTMAVRARFSHEKTVGTAGFGFWNEPFTRTLSRFPALPRAIWFFYAGPRSAMELALDVPGRGWKAATFDARRWPFVWLAPTAPIAFALMRVKRFYRKLWPLGQRAIGVSETLLDTSITEWHTYEIEWAEEHAHFFLDGEPVLSCRNPPTGPLGLVVWLDNQYMIVTPQGRFDNGLVKREEPQWLELDWIKVESNLRGRG